MYFLFDVLKFGCQLLRLSDGVLQFSPRKLAGYNLFRRLSDLFVEILERDGTKFGNEMKLNDEIRKVIEKTVGRKKREGYRWKERKNKI